MKPNPIPPQRPPLIEPCPWCAGELVIDETGATCAGCDVIVEMPVDARLAIAA